MTDSAEATVVIFSSVEANRLEEIWREALRKAFRVPLRNPSSLVALDNACLTDGKDNADLGPVLVADGARERDVGLSVDLEA